MRLVVLFVIFTIKLIECCNPKVISADVNSHRFVEHNKNWCEYIIEAHPTKSIQIALEYYYRFDVWLQFQVDGVKHEIYLARLENTELYWHYQYYKTPKNVGVRMKVERVGYNFMNFPIERIDVDHEICKFPYVLVGANEIVIQENQALAGSKFFETVCAYRLVPDVSEKSFNEIFLNFDHNIDYRIQKHNNGSIGELEHVNQKKLFPIGIIDVTFTRTGWIPRISSNLVHISCTCGDTTFSNFSESNMMSIRSPGFPSANCPLEECEYNINYASAKPELLLFDIRAELGREDQLIMDETVNYNKVINYPSYMPTSFAFEPRNVVIGYKSSGENIDRFFEINVTRISLSEECRCTSYLDKSYNEQGNFSFVIPKTCKNVLCYWNFDLKEASSMIRLSIEMSMENPNNNDVISCNDERFLGSQLVNEAFYSTKRIPMHIEFRRLNLTSEKDTRVTINWNFTEDCACPATHLLLRQNRVEALTTPNYPDNYCSNSKCWKYITAPNDTSIELNILNLELENFHDYLRIYDEKNNLIVELTGKYENHTIVSTGNVLNLLFESDSNKNVKGYFIHVTSKEKPHSSSLLLIFSAIFLVVLLIISMLCLLKFCRTRKSSNSTVQFSNYPTESSTSININSM